jgi:hypothetical protein
MIKLHFEERRPVTYDFDGYEDAVYFVKRNATGTQPLSLVAITEESGLTVHVPGVCQCGMLLMSGIDSGVEIDGVLKCHLCAGGK